MKNKEILEKFIEYANNCSGNLHKLELKELEFYTKSIPDLNGETRMRYYKRIEVTSKIPYNRLMCMRHIETFYEESLPEIIEEAYSIILMDILMQGIYGDSGLIKMYQEMDKKKYESS